MDETSVLTEHLFGFRTGRSRVTNLLIVSTRAIDVLQEREGSVDCVYLRLKKAFNKVPHQRLLWKLEHVGGLKGNILKWMKDYLTERQMRTVIRDQMSEWAGITSGVPQGSVLAPVMFLIYINDMVEGLNSYTSLFADDAKVMRRVGEEEDCRRLQEDIDRIYNWSREWEMEFNMKKCSFGNG